MGYRMIPCYKKMDIIGESRRRFPLPQNYLFIDLYPAFIDKRALEQQGEQFMLRTILPLKQYYNKTPFKTDAS